MTQDQSLCDCWRTWVQRHSEGLLDGEPLNRGRASFIQRDGQKDGVMFSKCLWIKMGVGQFSKLGGGFWGGHLPARGSGCMDPRSGLLLCPVIRKLWNRVSLSTKGHLAPLLHELCVMLPEVGH
jgi:hypothetical protein